MRASEKNKGVEQPFALWFKKSLCIGIIDRIFSFLFTLSCGYAVSHMLDKAMDRAKEGLIWSGAILLLLLAVGLPAIWILSKYAEKIRMRDRQRFREELYCRILTNRLEVSSVGEQELFLGNLSDQIAAQYQIRIPKIIEGLCIVIGATLLMCMECISIGILFSLMALIQILPVFTYEKWTKKIYEDSWDNDEAETDWITQGVDGIHTIKAYGAESWFVGRYQEINRHGIVLGNKAVATGGVESILYASIDAFLRYGSYVILGLHVLNGKISASSLPVLIVLSGYVFSSMEKLCTFLRYRATYQMAERRLKDALRQEVAKDDQQVLRVEGISKFLNNKQILSNINICIAAGERVKLCGANGSGKSTLIRIILGELTPDTGIVVRSGAQLGVALQEDPILSSPATSFLIALQSQENWNVEQFRFHLHKFHFPEELLTRPIKELSGGERRKLFLSIALARDTDLLILDEPTNHLDVDSRAYLKEVLTNRTCAMLICTHDPELCLSWDAVLHLEGGTNNE